MGISRIRCLLAAVILSGVLVSVAYAAGLAVTVQKVDSSEFPKVRVYVNVATEQGMTITGLEQQGFQLLEDDQPITDFRVEPLVDSQEPIAVALNMDVSGSMNDEGKMDAAKQAANAFMDTIGPKDTVSITSFSDTVQMVKGYTGDKAALQDAVNQLAAKGDTSLYDAVVQSGQLIGALPIQRRVIIVLTDGEDTKSKQSLDAAIEAAKNAGAAVLAVGLGGGVKKEILDKLAGETGGQAYYVSTGELKQLFLSFSDQLRRQYVLQYNSQLPADGKSHNIAVKAEERGRTGEGKGSFVANAKPLTLDVKGIANATEVSGTLDIQATVGGGTAKEVEFLVDDKSVGVTTEAPYGFKWDTAKEQPGMHKVVVQAKDAAGTVTEQTFAVSIAAPAKPAAAPAAPPAAAPQAVAPVKKEETNPLIYYAAGLLALLLVAGGGAFFVLRRRKPQLPKLEREEEAPEVVGDRTEVVKLPVGGWGAAAQSAAPPTPQPAPTPPQAAQAATPPQPAPATPPPSPAAPFPQSPQPPAADPGATVVGHVAPDPGATVVGSSLGETVIAGRPVRPKPPTGRLHIVFGSAERVETVSEGESTIGRQSSNRIVLSDPGASRWHAKITLVDGEFWIEDLRSANGTLVNDQPITLQKLASNDQIKISDTVITFTHE